MFVLLAYFFFCNLIFCGHLNFLYALISRPVCACASARLSRHNPHYIHINSNTKTGRALSETFTRYPFACQLNRRHDGHKQTVQRIYIRINFYDCFQQTVLINVENNRWQYVTSVTSPSPSHNYRYMDLRLHQRTRMFQLNLSPIYFT